MNKESRLPILNRHWHSSAVTRRTLKTFWISARQWTSAANAQAQAEATARVTTRATATATDGVHDAPALRRWPPPVKSCIERFKRGFSQYHIRKNHIDPPPGLCQQVLDAAFETWLHSSNNDDRWVREYKAWETSQGDSGQPVQPLRVPNSSDQQPPASWEDDMQRLPPRRTARQILLSAITCSIGKSITVNLRGGAGTSDPMDSEPLEEDEPANALGGSPIHSPENNPLAEDIPNESGDHTRNDALLGSTPPSISDSWIPDNDYGTFVYRPGPPRSHHSALSGYTTDLSRAASSAFREQNERAEEGEEATAATLQGAATALGQPSNGSGIPTPGNEGDVPSRRRFSFETQPSSGSRSGRVSSNTDNVVAWIPPSPSPRSRRTSSNLDDATGSSGKRTNSDVDEIMGEDDPLINPRPASVPSTNNVPTGVPPLSIAYNEIANIQPAIPSTRLRRRDVLRHAARREQLRERIRGHLLRAFRNILVMGSNERKLIRKKKKE